ncbi:DUF4062 domain-containing protein [Flagellimonas hymeniacidonis]|uniref:DUF4062 domain-containing protein n=1 Tax=Flagellimonas hymeniacidonis TaxID=2603628 RepID=A0A5C8V962_9FLAO|nr:LytTR family transcriptional regulator DNA-binding domain-containing protein [Flagellimonas hymeniacidonis]TXN37730.1 DUF4062 domain-containing protein [Flagellimonas hymeniacidonis]
MNIKRYRVFLASPGDIPGERVKVGKVIEELNLVLASRKILLELVKWESHAYPSIGTDAQDVINKQINDQYDIFLGIMWSRFGTPTKRADSGTLEEFERAYNRLLNNPNSIKIMFYFKDKPIPPSEIDPEQIRKIQNFKKSLQSLGALYWTYKRPKKLESIIRIHLLKVINELEDFHLLNAKIVKEKRKKVLTKDIRDDDTYNYLDTNDILYLKAEGRHTLFFMKDDTSVEAKEGISHFEKYLPAHFIRIHRSYILNSKFLVTMNHLTSLIRVKYSKEFIPFHKSKAEEIKQLVMKNEFG